MVYMKNMDTSTPFNCSLDVYSWLSGFVNFERGQKLKSLSLDRMEVLSQMSGRPEKSAASIHVAGSKGKGSVTGIIAAILEASGIKTARYSSPHVSDFRERLMSGNNFFTEDTYIKAGNELKELVGKLPESPKPELFDSSLENGEGPSFFELLTLWFFLCVREARLDAMAVETGMGGRLDATNILDPLVSVITLIELEHTEYLGNTIAAIAGEKAGIIKPGRPLVLSEQSQEALDVFRRHTAEKKVKLIYFPEYLEIQNLHVSREGTKFNIFFKKDIGFNNENFNEFFIPIPGEVQAKNSSLAILAAKTAFPDIRIENIKKAIAGFILPARFERISDTPPFIIDGAHTRQSMELCVNTYTLLYDKGSILVFGCAAGKDVLSMAKCCIPNFSNIIITTPGTFKISHPEEILKIFSDEALNQNNKPNIHFIPETEKAIDMAINLAIKNNLPILGAGSFYLAGEIRKKLNSKLSISV